MATLKEYFEVEQKFIADLKKKATNILANRLTPISKSKESEKLPLALDIVTGNGQILSQGKSKEEERKTVDETHEQYTLNVQIKQCNLLLALTTDNDDMRNEEHMFKTEHRTLNDKHRGLNTPDTANYIICVIGKEKIFFVILEIS